MSIFLSLYLPLHLSVYLSMFFLYISTCAFIYLLILFEVYALLQCVSGVLCAPQKRQRKAEAVAAAAFDFFVFS